MGWEDYLSEMQNDGTFDDKITLRATSEIFNVEFEAVLTLGPAVRQIITPDGSLVMTRSHLGHFAENKSPHYVTLNSNKEDCKGKYLHHFLHALLFFFRIRRKSTKEKEPMLYPITQLLLNY